MFALKVVRTQKTADFPFTRETRPAAQPATPPPLLAIITLHSAALHDAPHAYIIMYNLRYPFAGPLQTRVPTPSCDVIRTRIYSIQFSSKTTTTPPTHRRAFIGNSEYLDLFGGSTLLACANARAYTYHINILYTDIEFSSRTHCRGRNVF